MEDSRMESRKNFFKIQIKCKEKCEQFMVSLRKNKKQKLFRAFRAKRDQNAKTEEQNLAQKVQIESAYQKVEESEALERLEKIHQHLVLIDAEQIRPDFIDADIGDLDYLFEHIIPKNINIGKKMIQIIALLCKIHEDGIELGVFLTTLTEHEDIIRFLDSCCKSLLNEEMTDNCLRICQTLSVISKGFEDEIIESRGYLQALTRFCSEFLLEREQDKTQALVLLRILEPIFDKFCVDSLGEIADAVRALARYDWAMKQFFKTDSKILKVMIICLNFTPNGVYKKFLNTFDQLIKFIDPECLEMLISNGLLEALFTLLQGKLKPGDEERQDLRTVVYRIINMIICKGCVYTEQIYRSKVMVHIAQVHDDFGLIETVPLKLNLLRYLQRYTKMQYLCSKNFMDNLIKTLDLCTNIDQTQWCLEVFKIAMELSLNNEIPCFESLCKKFITKICESPVVLKLDELSFNSNAKIGILSRSILGFIEKAKRQELELSESFSFCTWSKSRSD
ncbi:unnamed protein product [Moneuplotes crassus]|uniref:Uncharacterized protein n=1 Tax=Euplotes crassus TaxID=5936 RepID=A0AAD1UCK8_EUPCR|nr:unnamed protein product [Moneuplotes crassus]